MIPFGPPDTADAPGDLATVEEKVDKLAAVLHLEWCDRCGDWRDLGHTDKQKTAPLNALEEQQYPTIG